jgi:murein L,D-transpeptidase YcbB/YkuD
MRKFLLASSAAALVLGLTGGALADHGKNAFSSSSLAPLRTTTATGLVFSKDAGEAKPLQRSESQVASTDLIPSSDQPAVNEPAATDNPSAPAEQTTQSLDQMKPAIAAEDMATSERLRDLVENRLAQFVPKEQDRAGVLVFYKERNFAPLWIANGKVAPRAEQAMQFLRGVDADGLDPADYPVPSFGNKEPAKLATDELTLTNSVVTAARHASIGRTAFSRVSGAVWYEQKAPAPADVLRKAAESSDVRAMLDRFNPQAPGYKALKKELAAVRAGNDIAPEPKKEAKTEDKAAKKKGKAAKKDNKEESAKPQGGSSKSARIETILANMERWRWMPDDLGPTYVMVNVPDYTLKVVQNGKTIWQTKIVVGKPGGHATPLLTETMKYITVNPTWNVPPSIIKNEYLPALARDPDALSRVGLKVSRNPDGSIRIYQPPGERNALGRIRFNFPNRFLVYQHDTPDKNLFAHDKRAYSHGCMRVQNPDEYAEVLLKVSQPQDNYTAARIRSMYGSGERTIPFKTPIPVYVTYQTAFVDDAGKAQYRADIYGLDRETVAVLHGDKRLADVPMPRNYNSSSKPVVASAPSNSRSRETTGSGSRYNAWASGRTYQSAPQYQTYAQPQYQSHQPQFDPFPQPWRSADQPGDRGRMW